MTVKQEVLKIIENKTNSEDGLFQKDIVNIMIDDELNEYKANLNGKPQDITDEDFRAERKASLQPQVCDALKTLLDFDLVIGLSEPNKGKGVRPKYYKVDENTIKDRISKNIIQKIKFDNYEPFLMSGAIIAAKEEDKAKDVNTVADEEVKTRASDTNSNETVIMNTLTILIDVNEDYFPEAKNLFKQYCGDNCYDIRNFSGYMVLMLRNDKKDMDDYWFDICDMLKKAKEYNKPKKKKIKAKDKAKN